MALGLAGVNLLIIEDNAARVTAFLDNRVDWMNEPPNDQLAFLAAKRSQGVAIGTLIGSNITDPLLSIGFAAVVHPLSLTSASFALTAYIIIPATFIGTGVALLMMRSEYEFKRWEGVILILIYMIFLAALAAEHQGYLVL